MAKCAYPLCPIEIASGGDNPPAFCEKHVAVKCSMPRCTLTTIPKSGFCWEHDAFVQDFDWIHGVRHQQAAQQMMEQQQAQDVLKKVMGKDNGHQKGIILPR